jgi:transposase
MTRTIKRYSEAFKRQVVAEYEAGSNISILAKKYGITGGMTIKYWIRKYAKEGFRHELVRIQTAEEANRVKELEQRVTELEQALGKLMLEKLKLESILEVLQEKEGDVVKKNALLSSSSFSGRPDKENAK